MVGELEYIAQEHRNLGTLTIRAWDRTHRGAGWVAAHLEPDYLTLRHVSTGLRCRLALPCRIAINNNDNPSLPAPTLHADHVEFKLQTADASLLTRPRPDLEFVAPWSATDLKRHRPQAFVCDACDAQLVVIPPAVQFTALPSEHWAELFDSWMCHPDQHLHDTLASQGRDGFWPASNEVSVASPYILCPIIMTAGWTADTNQEVRSFFNDLGFFPFAFVCLACPKLCTNNRARKESLSLP